MCWLPEKVVFKLWFGYPNVTITLLFWKVWGKNWSVMVDRQLTWVADSKFCHKSLERISLSSKKIKKLQLHLRIGVSLTFQTTIVLFYLPYSLKWSRRDFYLCLAIKCFYILLYHRLCHRGNRHEHQRYPSNETPA